MKKRLLAVCFCLLLTASLGMAASTDTLVRSDQNWDGDYMGIFDTLFDYFPAFDFDDVVGMIFIDPEIPGMSGDLLPPMFTEWNPYTEGGLSEDTLFWNYFLLANQTEWYLFENTFSLGLLTTPDIGDSFNPFESGFFMAYFISGPGSEPDPIPEPSTLILLASGIIGAGLISRRKLQKK